MNSGHNIEEDNKELIGSCELQVSWPTAVKTVKSMHSTDDMTSFDHVWMAAPRGRTPIRRNCRTRAMVLLRVNRIQILAGVWMPEDEGDMDEGVVGEGEEENLDEKQKDEPNGHVHNVELTSEEEMLEEE
ncbi:hypothetical protein BSKO_04914 [Bryopsis sp. KO-2023]|nr:hypothetical protein BSKO_04914 [Bryopsis sp. KO-2023]